jgi:ABC-2 type transport system permease protein
MFPILKKELHAFFSSLIGYLALVVFLMVCGLFMWVFDDNILDFGYATLDRFFLFSPWIMMFLLPALTMRSFSDEYRGGTIELLFTLPLRLRDIILGKYLAAFILVIFSILPTLLYVLTVATLSKGNIDSGGILGSYIGLLFLCGAFTSVGLFCSALSPNQVVSFIIAVFANFVLYAGFESLSRLPFISGAGADYVISQIGMQFHYQSISRGLLDTRDLVYFLSLIALFLYATAFVTERRRWS